MLNLSFYLQLRWLDFGYSIQFREPSFHSWNRPRIKISRKLNTPEEETRSVEAIIFVMAGNKRTISTSKIRKITANKKNRRENGRRAELIGSNPHSNGDIFSRSIWERLARAHATTINTEEIIKAKEDKVRIAVI